MGWKGGGDNAQCSSSTRSLFTTPSTGISWRLIVTDDVDSQGADCDAVHQLLDVTLRSAKNGLNCWKQIHVQSRMCVRMASRGVQGREWPRHQKKAGSKLGASLWDKTDPVMFSSNFIVTSNTHTITKVFWLLRRRDQLPSACVCCRPLHLLAPAPVSTRASCQGEVKFTTPCRSCSQPRFLRSCVPSRWLCALPPPRRRGRIRSRLPPPFHKTCTCPRFTRAWSGGV